MDGVDVLISEGVDWIQGPSERSKMKTFYSPNLPGAFALLIELPPGETLDRHEEPLFEIGYILKGSCSCGEGGEYPQGTFLFTPKGAMHGPFRSERGCLLLCVKFDR